MKKFKKIVTIIVTISLVLCFVGCMRMDVGVTVKEDGTATMTAKMSIAEDLYLMMKETDEGAAKDFVKETIDNEVYYSYSETKEYSSYDKLITDLKAMEATDGMPVFDYVDINKTDDGIYTVDIKTAVMDTSSLDSPDMEIPDDWFKLTMTVTMPGKIVEFEGGEKLEDGVIQFKLSDFEAQRTLYVQSEVSNFNVTRSVIIWIVGLATIAVVIVMRFKPRKKDDDQTSTESTTANGKNNPESTKE